MTEFKLSDKRKTGVNSFFMQDDVKEFIRLLKDKQIEYCNVCKSFECFEDFHERIKLISINDLNKLTGDLK